MLGNGYYIVGDNREDNIPGNDDSQTADTKYQK